MRTRFGLFKRGKRFYAYDKKTGKQESLRTLDKREASRLVHAKNEAYQQPHLNLQIARAYLSATDPLKGKRTWAEVMEAIAATKTGVTRDRWRYAIKDDSFDSIRQNPILDTSPDEILRVLQSGGVSTNVFFRRIHNFAVDMGWLPWPIIPKRQWPVVRYKEKRGITLEEHQRILEREKNDELNRFYQLCWHLGGSQSDIASLHSENVDWQNRTVSYLRKKTGTPVVFHFGRAVSDVLNELPKSGFLFPRLNELHEKHRAKLFNRRCKLLGISGISLHSYRYAWAERARRAGYPERFAQEALGHNSKAVHRAYAKRALVQLPSLEEFEERASQQNGSSQPSKGKIIPLPGKADPKESEAQSL